jgi:alpha-amylase
MFERPMRLRAVAARLASIAIAVVVAACQGSTATPSPSSTVSPSAVAPASASPSAAPSASPSPTPTTFDPYATTSADGLAQLAFPQRTVFVQLFEWKWTDVAEECEQWLGPRGFAAVQISPPNEHAEIDTVDYEYPWWERYQSVSYKLDSRSGTRAEFADMVSRCRAAGVEVYADVILNHMTAGAGTGSAGTVYTKYDYPGLYGPTDFHANANKAFPSILCDHSLQNSADPVEVQTCELDGLADLRTEEPKVQDTLAAYMADLYGLGVRGYRIDAAKHIDQAQLAQILDRLRAKLPAGATFFVDQEVTDFGGDAVPKDLYYPTGSVDDFVYTADITAAFVQSNENIASLEKMDAFGFIGPSDRSVVFTDNHDTQRGHLGSGLTLTFGRHEIYALANVFMLAYPFGYPRVMSSYVFDDTEAGPPSDSQGHTDSIYPADGGAPNCGLTLGQWVCEQRWHEIAGMVGFRDFTAHSPTVTDWWSNPNDPQQIAFGRGPAGFVVINRSESGLSQELQTSLAPGTYCDVVSGDLRAGGSGCTGPAVTVAADGKAMFDVPAMSAVAIHIGSKISGI